MKAILLAAILSAFLGGCTAQHPHPECDTFDCWE